MASAFGHAVAGYTIERIASGPEHSRRLMWVAIASSILPDIDVIGFKLGIEYGDMLGHRGVTHSILFAGLWTLIATLAFFPKTAKRGWISLVIFLSTLSHGFLDAMTTGGLGVGFFIPFSGDRYFFPLHPIAVSPIGVGAFWSRAFGILASEFIWIGTPCLIALGLHRLKRRARTQ